MKKSISDFTFTQSERRLLKTLSTPVRIQNYIDGVPVNWEKRGETYMSPRRALHAKKMHCFEGALLAALALWYHGEPPLLMDLQARGDDDHVVALYKRGGYWGAISKTNHATVRFRDPVYKTLRELALSYFHEYFDNATGKKCLETFSKPFDLRRFGTRWITTEKDLYDLVHALDNSRHYTMVPARQRRYLRRADSMERRAGRLREWKKSDPRT